MPTASAAVVFLGSFAEFQLLAGDTNLSDYVGAWGVDPVDGDVWAVVNHNSEFAVVPEPSAVILAVVAGMCVALRRLNRPSSAAS